MTDPIRIPAFCTQCRSRCGCEAVVEDGKLLRIEPQPDHPTGAKLCPKGLAATELVYHPDRLTHPLRRVSPKGAKTPKWEKISWDAALDEIAENMGRIREDHGAEQVAFSVTTPSGTHISDSISWIERFIRAYGSPNTIYGTEICNWHKDFASRLTYGTDIGTPDFANTDCVLLWGHNPAATWLARSTEIQKALRKGAKLLVIDPRPTLFARRADCWLKVRPGTDQALALGLVNLMLSSGQFDGAFVREWTNAGFLVRSDTGKFLRESDMKLNGSSDVLVAGASRGKDLLRYDCQNGVWLDAPDGIAILNEQEIDIEGVRVVCRSSLQIFAELAAKFTPERVAEITGVSGEDLQSAATIISESASVAYYAWNGVGQSTTATQTDRAISILYALTGCYGGKGGNVPGGAASFNDIAGADLLSAEQKAKALGLDERPLGPAAQGWATARDVYRAISEHQPYPVRMLFSFGGNVLAAQPDTENAIRAFKNLEFHVHTDFFLNASAEYADIVVPVATSWERGGLRTGFDASLEGMRKVQLRPCVVEPVGEARGDTDIVLELSKRLGLSPLMFGCDEDKGHEYILAPSGLDLDTLKGTPEGVTLEHKVPLKAYKTAGFPTSTKRVEIYSEHLLLAGYPAVPTLSLVDLPQAEDKAYPLRLGSAKSVAYCHSQGRNIPSLRRLMPDPILEMSMHNAAARGIAENDWVEIVTKAGSFVARAKPHKDIAEDAVFAQHGWTVSDETDMPNTKGDRHATNMNTTVSSERCDPISGSIALRCSWCEIKKVSEPSLS